MIFKQYAYKQLLDGASTFKCPIQFRINKNLVPQISPFKKANFKYGC